MPATVLPPKLRIDYPRPQLVNDHATLFVEPTYEDGEPYAQDDEENGPEG
ncbi:hypothetical protein ACL07V_37125 [Streptomyces sp. MB22_4]